MFQNKGSFSDIILDLDTSIDNPKNSLHSDIFLIKCIFTS